MAFSCAEDTAPETLSPSSGSLILLIFSSNDATSNEETSNKK